MYGVKNVQNQSIKRLMYIRAIRPCVRVREGRGGVKREYERKETKKPNRGLQDIMGEKRKGWERKEKEEVEIIAVAVMAAAVLWGERRAIK